VDNLNKKQKFIILTVLGSIIILASFIWSMYINLSKVNISNPVPDVKLPAEISEIIDESKTNSNSITNNNNQNQDINDILEPKNNNNTIKLNEDK
jgi:hypothetical protein